MESSEKPSIGFVGQGYIGKNYADDFERRGFSVIRYSLEEPYRNNRERLREAEIVFVAVPTPTTPEGFNDSIVREAVGFAPQGAIVVIKSTILPGTTKSIQEQYPEHLLFYSPEFLSETTAEKDAANPFSNIVGTALHTEEHHAAAKRILSILPKAPYTLVCDSTEAEIIKYSHNGNGYSQIVFFNMMHDLATSLGVKWELIEHALRADPMISNWYLRPVHKSGRGAGGNCFVKDIAALRAHYDKTVSDEHGVNVFRALEKKNIELLKNSGKDLHIVQSVYGDLT